jgi:hypothetical protein
VSLEWTVYAREKPIVENVPSGTSFEVWAIAEYAKRYDLPPERARRVIDAHR